MVYQQTNDLEISIGSLHFLITFDNWYSTEHDIDNDGLIGDGAYETVLRKPAVLSSLKA